MVVFQSTRPRGARLQSSKTDYLFMLVSIHAPAWGATPRFHVLRQAELCFNPRARVGRDTPWRPCRSGTASFNPRARVGRDVGWCAGGPHRCRFNPRARVGRDGDGDVRDAGRTGFNPRARVGRDLYVVIKSHAIDKFQSTRPRGARRGTGPDRRTRAGFNPRARVGRDQLRLPRMICPLWFQSTRPRGARRGFLSEFCPPYVSIHAPAWGATLNYSIIYSIISRFNPRARVGRDSHAADFNFPDLRVSIHAPAWGATRAHCGLRVR